MKELAQLLELRCASRLSVCSFIPAQHPASRLLERLEKAGKGKIVVHQVTEHGGTLPSEAFLICLYSQLITDELETIHRAISDRTNLLVVLVEPRLLRATSSTFEDVALRFDSGDGRIHAWLLPESLG